MIDVIDQQEFNRTIILIALSMCFKANEEYLSDSQIIYRGFSPFEDYGKCCLAKLIEDGVVQFKICESFFPFDNAEKMVFVRCPAGLGSDLESYKFKKSVKILHFLRQSFDYILYLREFHQELLACEIIEYTDYYANKNSFKVLNPSTNNAKLKLLLLEKKPEQIYSLVWRSIKSIQKKLQGNVDAVDFSVIVDTAFENYIRCQRLGIEIDEYSRPSQFKTSSLLATIEFFKSSIANNST